jgi:RimJ/RimL family protein N-acetyltransferase
MKKASHKEDTIYNPKKTTIDTLVHDIINKILPAPQQVLVSINHIPSLSIKAETSKLILKTTTLDDQKYYQELMSNPLNMKTFYNGQVPSQESILNRVKRYNNNLMTNNPFTGYSIFTKENKFVGFIGIAGTEDKVGQIAYVLDKAFWNQGYGKEATYTLVYCILPSLIKAGYKFKVNEQFSKPQTIKATALVENKPSQKILKKLGFSKEGEKFSAAYDPARPRKKYTIEVDEIMSNLTKIDNALSLQERAQSSLISKVDNANTIPLSSNISTVSSSKGSSSKRI